MILEGDISTGRGMGAIEIPESYEMFQKTGGWGNDKILYNKLNEGVSKEKKREMYLVRAEVKNLGKLTPRIQGLKKDYPTLEFFVYSADIGPKKINPNL